MNKDVVVIGAGGTGRGFLARLLQEDGATLCFIDKDEELIRALSEKGCFQIGFGEAAPPFTVSDYEAYPINSEAALSKTVNADWVFISIGEKLLPTLTDFLKRAADARTEPLRVVVCENGIAPKQVLRDALESAGVGNVLVTQGVIFCTSIPAPGNPLDIVSENYNALPFDYDEELFTLPFPHFPATKGFDRLLQRKIYTYNCLSACIAYAGFYLGYTVYADAANDPLVVELCERACGPINGVMCKYMGVTAQEQHAFSQRALDKFRNRQISDTIQKNARSAAKKLGPTERIMGPLRLMREYGEETATMTLVAALALHYLECVEALEWDGIVYLSAEELFRAIDPDLDGDVYAAICRTLEQIRDNKPLKEIARL